MLIRSWGARGSIPVSGPQYIRYGGDTTCLEVRGEDGKILVVDAGTGIRRLGNLLVKNQEFDLTMLFTHAHWDHILGFPFFKPVHRQETRIEIYGCPMEQGNMETLLSKTMSTPFFPVPYAAIHAQIRYNPACGCDSALQVGAVAVTSIPLNHPNMGVGYKFVENGKSLVFLTDNELKQHHRGGRAFEEYVAFCAEAEILIHDAEYTPEEYPKVRGWGHSTYMDALELALAARVKSFGLFHHNQDRGDEELDEILAHCRRLVQARGASIECFCVGHDTELIL
jgi:phosphoribosyl 1,2-cyclic phosphodiesterase